MTTITFVMSQNGCWKQVSDKSLITFCFCITTQGSIDTLAEYFGKNIFPFLMLLMGSELHSPHWCARLEGPDVFHSLIDNILTRLPAGPGDMGRDDQVGEFCFKERIGRDGRLNA